VRLRRVTEGWYVLFMIHPAKPRIFLVAQQKVNRYGRIYRYFSLFYKVTFTKPLIFLIFLVLYTTYPQVFHVFLACG